MNGKKLRAIRKRMGLSQAAMGDCLRLTGNSIARMERDEVTITPSMELLIGYVAREAGVDPSHAKAGSRAARAKKRAHGSHTRHSAGKGRARPGSDAVSSRIR